MRIIGVDPGLVITGYGVIEWSDGQIRLITSGAIKPPQEKRMEEKIEIIYQDLRAVLAQTRPEIMILEQLYSHYQHPTTSILMGHVRGAVCLLARLEKIPVVGYAATRVKKSITGKGNATKGQVQYMIQNLLGMKEVLKPLDVSDAVALAVTHTHHKGGRD